MLSAMAGSMIRVGGLHEVERRQRQRDAVRDRERRDDDDELADGAAEQQQPDQEEQVVRTDQDVIDAGRQHSPTTASAPCRVPVKYSKPVRPLLEDRLRQRGCPRTR